MKKIILIFFITLIVSGCYEDKTEEVVKFFIGSCNSDVKGEFTIGTWDSNIKLECDSINKNISF